MTKSPLALALIATTLLSSVSESQAQLQASAEVTWVTDGDTLRVKMENGREEIIRVLGIDCPETSPNDKCVRRNRSKAACLRDEVPRGNRAKKEAIRMLRKGRQNVRVVLESGKSGRVERDHFKRILAYVQLPGNLDYGKAMIGRGLCEDNSDKYSHSRQDDYKKTQARSQRR